MTVVAVTFNGTRVNAADANTNWGNFPSGGGAPASEAQIAYQNGLAVNTKVVSTSLDGVDYDPGANALDMTAAANRLLFVKLNLADFSDANATYGIAAGIGSALADHYLYNMAGSGANLSKYSKYPPQGGYILTAIDPNIAAWRESTVGTPDLTAVDWFGGQCAMINGGAKSENFAMDSIDVGTGLQLVGGTGADPLAKFTDYVAFDQDIIANRWGVCKGSGLSVTAWGLLEAAGAVEMDDSTSIVTFSDGYHSRGLVGVLHDLDTAASTYDIGALFIGEGTRNGVDANDTRPDYTVLGTTMTALYNFHATLVNFRDVTFNSKVDCDGGDIECHLLVQDTAEIQNSVIRTNALTSVACLQDPTFGVTTGLHDTDFIQSGVGHAIEITGTTARTFTNLNFTGYGADTTDDAALDLLATSGTIDITIDGGNTPTYKSAGVTPNFITGVITLQVTVLDATDDTPLTTAHVQLLKDSDKSVLLTGAVNGSGIISDTISYDVDTDLVGWAREHNVSGTDYTPQDFTGQYTASGFFITIRLEPAE